MGEKSLGAGVRRSLEGEERLGGLLEEMLKREQELALRHLPSSLS